MAAPVYKSAGAGASRTTTGTTSAYTCPATVDANDLLFLPFTSDINTMTITSPPTGWSQDVAVDTWSDRKTWYFWKVADGSEDGASVTVTHSSSSTARHGRVYSFSGNAADLAAIVAGNLTSGSDASAEMPSATSPNADCLAVAHVLVDDNTTMTQSTGESGGDWTESVSDYSTTTGSNLDMELQTASLSAAGTISGGSSTVSGARNWIVRTWVVKSVLATAKTSSGWVNHQNPGWM